MATTATIARADAVDSVWLEERIEAIRQGADAVIEVAQNWHEGRCVGRLHRGVQVGDFIAERVGPLRLSRAEIARLTAETKMPNTEIAKVAGVSDQTVMRIRRDSPNGESVTSITTAAGVERPATYAKPIIVVEPAAPEFYHALMKALRIVDQLYAEAMHDNSAFLLDVPDRERERLNSVARRVQRMMARITAPEYRL